MKNRKILFIDLGVAFGGIATYLGSLTQILSGKAEMYAICANSDLAAALSDRKVTTLPNKGLKDRGKLKNMLAAALLLVWARVRYGVSIVWINGNSEIALLPMAKILGCTAVATRHLTMDTQTKEWHSTPSRKIAQTLYEHLAFTADKIFCVSGCVSRDVMNIVGPDKVSVIPNWVSSVPSKVCSPDSSDRKLKMLFVGRLERYKGASLILEAMRGLEDRVSLTIVGEGPYRGELEKQADGLDVCFAGFQKDPRRFYSDSDIFINPSVGPEGLPLVSLEAMSFGLPCILSGLDVHKEISGNGESAALFRIGDASELRTRIAELATNFELRSAYGRKAHAAIIARHSPQVARRAYLEQLDALGKAA